jgi:hypothetical protein
MHDCPATRRELTDLRFNELSASRRAEALREVETCPDCAQWWAEVESALAAVHAAAMQGERPDDFWERYQRRLRSRLPVSRRALWRRAGLGLAAAAALLAVAFLVREERARDRIPEATLTAVARDRAQPGAPARGWPGEHAGGAAAPGGGARRRASSRPGATVLRTQDLDYARHLEAVRLLLITVKNAEAPVESAGDRRRARRLLASNRLLRRAAEWQGETQFYPVLDSVEPFLLDLANSSGVSEIRDRLKGNPVFGVLVNPYAETDDTDSADSGGGMD